MKTRLARFHKTIIALLLVGACHSDELVSPDGPMSLTADFVPVGSVTLNIPNQNSPTATVALPNFTKRVLLRATITGTVDIDLTPYNPGGSGAPTVPGAPRTVGPQGYAYAANPPQCGARVQVGYGSYGGGTIFYVPCGTSDQSGDTITTSVGYLYSSVAGGSAVRSSGTGQSCYQPTLGWGPCFYYSTGGQTIALDRITAELEVTAAPTTVNYLDTVTVTASISPAQVGGLNVPWAVDSTKWVPTFGTQAAPCTPGTFSPSSGDSPTRTCRKPFTRSGTLTVFVTINGDVKQQSVTITVTPPQLDVTASPASIPSAQSVTFTASVTPTTITWNLSSWTWRPDSGTGGLSSPGYCAWYEKTCTRTVSKSGWMKGTAVIGEYTLKDSARVFVGACDPEVQTMVGEYVTFNVNIRPTCPDFTNTGGSTHFSWSELNGGFTDGNPHNPWGMVTNGLTTGLEATRTNYNRGGILLTSGYRCPHGNAAVGGVAQSLHMHGRAGDMYSADHGGLAWTQEEFELLRQAAQLTGPEELGVWDDYPDDRHLHAAW